MSSRVCFRVARDGLFWDLDRGRFGIIQLIGKVFNAKMGICIEQNRKESLMP